MIKPIFGADGTVIPGRLIFRGAPQIRHSVPAFKGAPTIRHSNNISFKSGHPVIYAARPEQPTIPVNKLDLLA